MGDFNGTIGRKMSLVGLLSHVDPPNIGMERTSRAADFQVLGVLRRRSSRIR